MSEDQDPDEELELDEKLECLDGPDGHDIECRGLIEYRMALSATGRSFPRCLGTGSTGWMCRRGSMNDTPTISRPTLIPRMRASGGTTNISKRDPGKPGSFFPLHRKGGSMNTGKDDALTLACKGWQMYPRMTKGTMTIKLSAWYGRIVADVIKFEETK